MPAAPAPDDRRLHVSDFAVAALVAGAAFALYLALGQGVLYGDGAEFMVLLHEGAAGHKNHLVYVPLLHVSAAAGARFSLSAFASARLLSQLGAAFGVGVFYLVSRRLGLPRTQAVWIAALIASTPSVLFFATVVEVHAPYFAFLSLAWLAAVHVVARPTTARGVLLGLVTAAAYCGHASGLVLPLPLLLVVAHLRASWRGVRAPALACLATHTILVTILPWLASHTGHTASPANAARFLTWWKIEVLQRPHAALLVLWDEWLLAYLPLCLLWLRAFQTQRRAAWLTLVTLLPYLALSIALLAVYREFGAYQHAVVWLLAWLTTLHWGASVRAAAVVLGLAVGMAKVGGNDDRARVAAYAQGLATAAAGATPLLLVGGPSDYEHCFIAQPAVAFVNLATQRFGSAGSAPAALADLDAHIARHRAKGGVVFLTAEAVDLLARADAATPEQGLALTYRHVRAHYEHRIVAEGGFRAAALTPRVNR